MYVKSSISWIINWIMCIARANTCSSGSRASIVCRESVAVVGLGSPGSCMRVDGQGAFAGGLQAPQ